MGVLSFQQQDESIVIKRRLNPIDEKTSEKEFSLEGLKSLVTKYLKYYNEGETDISDSINLPVCNKISDYNSGVPPVKFSKQDSEYWYCRKELYDFVKKSKLFSIKEIDQSIPAIKREAKKIESREKYFPVCNKGILQFISIFDIVQDVIDNNFSSESMNNYIIVFEQACTYLTENLCQVLEDEVYNEFSISDREVKCEICPLETRHKDKGDIYFILHELWTLLKEARRNSTIDNELKKKLRSLIKNLDKKKSDIDALKAEWGING